MNGSKITPLFSPYKLYRNNLKNRFLTMSAFLHNFCFHSRLALRQWSLAPKKNSEGPPCQIPDSSGHFGIRALLLCHIIVALLLSSLFLPWTQKAWEIVDIAFFKWINHSLIDRPVWQLFWALANHKLADWVEDLCILSFFIAYIRQAPVGLRKKRIAQFLILLIYVGAVIYFVNGMFFREYWTLPRLSPTLVVENSVRLSHEITWLSIKDGSSKSFPGDHGTTALLFAASFTYLAGWRLGILSCLYAAFLCMPRLITGAHWFSDIIVGSGSIAILFLGWAFCTPLFTRATALLERVLSRLRKKQLSNFYS